MNSNLFTNAMPGMQSQFENPSIADSDFTSWGDPQGGFQPDPFQSDGPQIQNWNTPFGTDGSSQQQMPNGLFAAIARAIQEYFHGSSEQGSCEGPNGNEGSLGGAATPFQNVNVSSTGDPHEALSGTRPNGSDVNAHWDSMQSHGNLLSAPSVDGGLRFSSQVGTPNSNGATMNQSITATADHGRTAINFNADGNATVRQGNFTNILVPNETMQLGRGLSVTDQGNSLILHAQNANGGTLNTTLSDNGQGGVDMQAQGNDIALGGYLVNSQ